MKNECPVAQITFVGSCPNKTCMWWTSSKAVPSKCIKIYNSQCSVSEYCKMRGVKNSMVSKAVRSIKNGIIVAEYSEWNKGVQSNKYFLTEDCAIVVTRIALNSRVLCTVGSCVNLNEVLNLLDKSRYKRFIKIRAVQDAVSLEEIFDLRIQDLNSLWRKVKKITT